MQPAETLSPDRTVPAVLTIAVHLLFLYVAATSTGVIPKSAPLKDLVLVPTENKSPPIEKSSTLPPPQDSAFYVPTEFPGPKTPPIIEIEPRPIGEPIVDTSQPQGIVEETTSAVRLLYRAEPEYPNPSRLRAESGVVYVRVTIAPSGEIGDVVVEKSSGFARLDAAALKAVRTWRFAPAMRGGRAVAASVLVPVRFELQS